MQCSKPIIAGFAVLMFFLEGCEPWGAIMTRVDDLSLTSPFNLPITKSFVDSQGVHWAFLVSNWYGYHDLWLTSSADGITWRRPFFSTVPAVGGTFSFDVKDYKLGVKLTHKYPEKLQFWHYRTSWYDLEDSCVISLSDLQKDTDADGLTDMAEYVLSTDPLNNDTDGDGKADGYDQNPLSSNSDSLSVAARLHKQIIEWELDGWDYVGAVLVEQFDSSKIEYRRKKGIILTMPADSVNAYLQINGYGIPVLSAKVEPAHRDMYKAEFTLFIAPDDADGFVALFKYQNNSWVRKRTLDQWVAE